MEISNDELMSEFSALVATLQANLPSSAPMFLSNVNDPCRALHLREACLHRVTELAESSLDAFKKNNNVAGYLLARAIMETVALFIYFLDKTEDAVASGDVKQIQEVLTHMLIGTKSKMIGAGIKKAFEDAGEEIPNSKLLDPIHVMDLIKHVSQKIPPYAQIYDFLSEVAHPNALGLVRTYVKIDWAQKIAYFGKEHGELGSHLESDLETIVLVLRIFIIRYNESAVMLEKLQHICEETSRISPT